MKMKLIINNEAGRLCCAENREMYWSVPDEDDNDMQGGMYEAK